MLPGDVIAFGGRGAVSDVIRRATGSTVSHVGVVAWSEPLPGGHRVDVVESTSLDGLCGVARSRLSSRLLAYRGEVWWAPLAPAVRARLDVDRFFAHLAACEGRSYDLPGAVVAGLARLGLPTWGQGDDGCGRLFCSELVAGALAAGGAIGALDASRVTPAGLLEWRVYHDLVQVLGAPLAVPRFNSLPVGERGL